MNKHSLTLNNGTIETRNSKTRVYTHALVVVETREFIAKETAKLQSRIDYMSDWDDSTHKKDSIDNCRARIAKMHEGREYVIGWSQRPETAEKTARREAKYWLRVEVRPVTLS